MTKAPLSINRLLKPIKAQRPQLRKMATDSNPSALMRTLSFRNHPNIKIPRVIYGTAWKKDRTATLVYQALKAGFRAIDTAAQPRHYNEAEVGAGIRRAIGEGIIRREDLYIQTKFTPPSGQDHANMPYSLSQNLRDRITSSINSSLQNMTLPGSEPYIDCLVLHSPLPTIEETLGAWEILSTFVPKNIHSLGISNTSLETLQYLYSQTILKPSVVQNRFYSETKWEVQLRKWCREKGIVFQSFWTLTGNPKIMASSIVKDMSEALDKVGVQDPTTVALYSLVIGLNGTCVLDGTTNDGRMKSDLEGLEVMGRLIEGEWRGRWAQWLGDFKKMIGELEDN